MIGNKTLFRRKDSRECKISKI